MPTSAVAPAPTETVDAAAADQQSRPSTPARPAPITATPALMNAAPAVRLTPPTPAIAPNDAVQEDVENIESPPSVEQAEAQADAAVVEGAAPGAESPRTVETEASTDDTAGTAAAEAAPSQVPADPQQHAPFQAAMSNLRGGAKKVKAHDPAAKKAEEAQAAAEPPANEKAAGAKAVQVDTMKSADTEKEVDKSSFLELLRAEIAKVMPKDLEEADDYMKGGDKQQLKGALKGGIEGEKEKTTGSLEAASAQAPDESKVEGKAVTPIPDTESPQPPQTIGAAEAMPPQRGDEEIKPDKEESDRMLEDADITTEQMDKANDPRFDAVNQSKGEADTYADTAPAEYRQRETDILDQASTQATDAAGRGLDAMGEARDSADSQVGGDQQTAKTKDELRRQEVTDHIEGIYKRTKERVDEKLKNLETEVFGVFDTGVETAINAMRDYVESRFDDRYSGVRGKARWLKDKILPLPDFAKAWFTQAHDRFKNDLDALVVRVANLVEQRLQEAKDEIDAGQREIKEYVDGLEGDLKEVGQAAANEINSRFDDLRKSVDDKRAGLAEQLAQRYKAATERGAKVLQELKDAHKSLLERLRDAIMEVVRILREFKDRVMSMLRKGLDTIRRIVADPIGFLKNILAAVMQGLRQFVANIWTHLKNGFMGWLFGSLASAGIQMPREFTIGAIFGVILQILGLTYDRIRAKAVRLIGERNVAIIEHVAGFLRTLFTRGPAALWEELKEFAGNLYDTVISAIQQWVITTIIRAAVTKLVTMFNPVGAIIQAIITIYNVVMFFIERINQIIEFVSAVIDSVDNIVKGNISAAANFIELALARTIPIIISFLARLIGLGGITQKIREIISSIQARVDRALDMLIAKVVKAAKGLIGRVTGKNKESDVRGEPKTLAREKLREELQGTHSRAEVVEIAARVARLLREQGVKRIVVGEEDAKGNFAVLVEASPLTPEVLLSIQPTTRLDVNLAATLEFAEPQTFTPQVPFREVQALQPKILKSGALGQRRERRLLEDPSSPGKFVQVSDDDPGIAVIRPEPLEQTATEAERRQPVAASTIQVLGYNVGATGAGTENVTHAEVQFISWFKAKFTKAQIRTLRKLTINISESPCSSCAHDLCGFVGDLELILSGESARTKPPLPEISLLYVEPHYGKNSTTVEDIAALRGCSIDTRHTKSPVTLTNKQREEQRGAKFRIRNS